jgi:hypothetical protein
VVQGQRWDGPAGIRTGRHAPGGGVNARRSWLPEEEGAVACRLGKKGALLEGWLPEEEGAGRMCNWVDVRVGSVGRVLRPRQAAAAQCGLGRVTSRGSPLVTRG